LDWLFLPLLTILVIVPPVWVLVGLGTYGLEFGPRWRALGIFGIGMTLGPLIMIIGEIILAAIFLIGLALFLASKPSTMQDMIRISGLIQKETDPETIVTLLAPYIVKPGVIVAAISFFSLLVPMIEEMFKPLGIWLFAREIDTPAQGFALGLMSGAAYALVESLGVSGQGGQSWPVIVSVRAGTSLLHILTTGLMGWAIVAVWRERQFIRLLATYGTVVVIHGLWNAAAIGTGFATIADSLGESNFILSVLPAAICGMSVMGIGLIAVLIASNRRARILYPTMSNASEKTPALQNTNGVK